MEREFVREDATADMSLDISNGQRKSNLGSMPHVESNLTLLISKALEGSARDEEKPAKKVYIVFFKCMTQP